MGTKSRREREKQQRYEDILRVAKQMFWRQGFQQTTMKQIADAAELASGTLYLYFPSKNEIYVELLIQGYDILIDMLRNTVEKNPGPGNGPGKVIDTFFDFAQSHPEYFDIIFFIIQREGSSVQQEFIKKEYFSRLEEKEKICKQLIVDYMTKQDLSQDKSELGLTVEAVWTMLTGVVFFYLKDGPAAFLPVATRAKEIIISALES